MDKTQNTWTIDCENPIGPISSYSLALWGIRGLLYPNDLLVDQNRTRYRAGFMTSLQNIMRNTRDIQKPEMWAIAGRKGGVGKSVLCSLMGIALSKLNKKVVIVDANFGCSIQSYNFGIEKSLETFYESIHDNDAMGDFACPTPYPNLSIIAYKNGTCGPAAASIMTKMRFLRTLKMLDADYVLLDLGSRIDDSGLDYFLNCDKNIIVTTPELPSLQNVTLFLKNLFKRKLDTAIFSLNGDAAAPQGLESDLENSTLLKEAISYLKKFNLPHQLLLNRAIKSFNVKLVFNMVMNDAALPSRVLSRYFVNELGIHIDIAGQVKFEPLVRRALRERRLGLLESSVLQEVNKIVGSLIQNKNGYSKSEIKSKERKNYSPGKIMCGINCINWNECEVQNPGHPCPYKNIR